MEVGIAKRGTLAVVGGLHSMLKTLQLRCPLLEKDTGNKFVVLAFFCAVSAVIVGEQQRRTEDKQMVKRRTCAEKMATHPLGAWLFENACCVALAASSSIILPPPTRGSRVSAFAVLIAGVSVMQWLSSGLMTYSAKSLYKSMPTFNEPGRSRPDWTLRQHAIEFLHSHAALNVATAAMAATGISKLSREQHHRKFVQRKINPVAFLAKLAVVRFTVDIGFWMAHGALHHPYLYWIHRTHHEHHRPSVSTNFHFSTVDLWVEAVLPLYPAFTILRALQMQLVRFEKDLLLAYITWHQVGSHCAKALPCVTFFPPLAPMYQLLLGPADRNNVKHHDVHHARLNCNYSISIWPDILMGTRIVDHSDKQRMSIDYS